MSKIKKRENQREMRELMITEDKRDNRVMRDITNELENTRQRQRKDIQEEVHLELENKENKN